MDGFESKPHNTFFPKSDFSALLVRYGHSA